MNKNSFQNRFENDDYVTRQDRPIIAGHRGMAGLLPENTLESLHAAVYEGADFIELDVVLTKDLQVLVAHDVYLSRLTNIADFPQYQDRKKIKEYKYHKNKEDWWVNDFTLDELKQLGVKQTILQNRPKWFDLKFNFPTLNEVITMMIQFNQVNQGKKNFDDRIAGILLEIKDTDDQNISKLVFQCLQYHQLSTKQEAQIKCPIVIMSFNHDSIEYFHQNSNLPRIKLVWKLQEIYPLKNLCQNTNGIGIDLKLIWDQKRNRPHELYEQLRKKGLFIYTWTIRDDDNKLLNFMGVKNSVELYRKLMNELNIDGIITEFPEKAVNIISIIKEERYNKNSQSQYILTDKILTRDRRYSE